MSIQSKPRQRCRGLTKKGSSCGMYAVAGSDFCKTHQHQTALLREDTDADGVEEYFCPFCHASIIANAKMCPYCESMLKEEPTGEYLLKNKWTENHHNYNTSKKPKNKYFSWPERLELCWILIVTIIIISLYIWGQDIGMFG